MTPEMTETTARLSLPLIQPGQAQKELWHNEALALLDLAVQPVAVAVGLDVPPAAPTAPLAGQCWVVGSNPTGTWAGRANALAGWTAGGWRFLAPTPGMTVQISSSGGFFRWNGTAWVEGVLTGAGLRIGGEQVVGPRRPAIAGAAGGGTVDAEARATLDQVLNALRDHGLIGR